MNDQNHDCNALLERAMLLLDNARPTFMDPALRRQWARERTYLRQEGASDEERG